MTWEKLKQVIDDLKEKFRDSIEGEVYVERKIGKVILRRDSLIEVARYLRDVHGFDQVKGVTGVDLVKLKEGGGPFIEVIYHLGSLDSPELIDTILNISVRLDRENPRISSLYTVWPSVEYHEREVYEMFGVIFEGHPNLKRLLLPEYWMDIPPLRKDYKIPGRD
ncbi:MAG: NADH-quinone oxidoreductase subunit C [Nitrososphaerota archaeon]|nr:NADH-quinone oxidoreductase subunit C [Nitrososphaerota archaeon]